MHFDLAKYFKNLYLAEVEELPKGKWEKLSKAELADYEGDIFTLIANAYSYLPGGHSNYGSKRSVVKHKIDRLKKPGFYIEVSGRIKDILVSANVPQVKDKATIEKALPGKEIMMNDDGSYRRKIGGKFYEKVMMGTPIA